MTRGGGTGGAGGSQRGRVDGVVGGGDVGPDGARHRGNDGLNPSRQRGFNWQQRIVTPTLNDMRAKQGAVVSKFMTFMNRKNSVKIELYEKAFYNKKPGWDSLANFVYSDLCPSDQLRDGIEDVQDHPVKLIIFIKFKTEDLRDQVHDRLRAGIFWTEYGVTVRGHSLDANVKFIRVLGVSPETTGDDIKNTFNEVGIGEVIDLRKGLLDPKRLPGVTNGTWLVRVRILDADKNIPPYIIRREEGELWSLNFEGRRFVCWKCGSPNHIGDKCRDQERTFEEVFGDDREAAAAGEQSWAAVVKGKSGLDPAAIAKRDAIAKQIKENNKAKNKEKKELEEKMLAESEENERRRQINENARDKVINESRLQAQQVVTHGNDGLEDDSFDEIIKANSSDQLAGQGVGSNLVIHQGPGSNSSDQVAGQGVGNNLVIHQGPGSRFPPLPRRTPNPGDPRIGARQEDDPGGGNRDTVEFMQKLVIDSIDPALFGEKIGGGFQLDNSLERIFGGGATKLAIEFEGASLSESVHNMSESSSDHDDDSDVVASTPKKRMRDSKEKFGNLSSISEGDISGEGSENGLEKCESKKQKVELSEEESLEEIDHGNGNMELLQPGTADQIEVTLNDPGVGQEPGQPAAEQVHDQFC